MFGGALALFFLFSALMFIRTQYKISQTGKCYVQAELIHRKAVLDGGNKIDYHLAYIEAEKKCRKLYENIKD